MLLQIYKAFIENNPCPIWVHDEEGQYVQFNTSFQSLCDKNTVIIGSNIDQQILNFNKELTQKVLTNKTFLVQELTIKDVEYECQLIPLVTDNFKLVLGVVGEATKKKRYKDQLELQLKLTKAILDTIPHNVYYKNKESEYVLINETCEKFYQSLGVTEIVGKNDFEINPFKVNAKKHVETDQTVMNSKEVLHMNAIFPSEEEVRHFEVVKAPVIDEDGGVLGVVGVSRDVTEHRRLEEKLRYLSYTDILTGVYNRTSFEEKIKDLMYQNPSELGIIMGDVNGLKLINDGFGHIEGDRLLKSIASILSKVCEEIGFVFRWGGDEFVMLLPNADESICEQVMNQIQLECQETEHHLIELSISLGMAIHRQKNKDIFVTLKEAEEQVYRHKLLDHHSRMNSMLVSLQETLETISLETSKHTKRMSVLANNIGKQLGMSAGQLDELELVTQLHDIGKIGISREILMKEGPLTDEEYEIIKQHPEKGYRIVRATKGLESVAKGVLHHHERYDGTGYPFGLVGEEIPLYSRIVAVADTYDAMTNARSYRAAMTHDEAVAELKRVRGTQLDPQIVDIFLNQIKRSEVI